MTIEPFWVEISEPGLRQGDLLPRCLVPIPDSMPSCRMCRRKGRQSSTT